MDDATIKELIHLLRTATSNVGPHDPAGRVLWNAQRDQMLVRLRRELAERGEFHPPAGLNAIGVESPDNLLTHGSHID